MKFGILGEAKIAREWLVPAILDAGHEVTHIGRRNPGKEPLPSIYKGAIETDYDITFSRDFFDRVEFSDLYMWCNKNGDNDELVNITELVNFNGGSGDFTNITEATSIGEFTSSSSSLAISRWENDLTITPSSGFDDVEYQIKCFVDGVAVSDVTFTGTETIEPPPLQSEPNTSDTYEMYFTIAAPLGFSYSAKWKQQITSSTFGFPPTTTVNVYNTFTPINVIDGDLIIKDNLPKIKIIDFLKGIFSAFKLIFQHN